MGITIGQGYGEAEEPVPTDPEAPSASTSPENPLPPEAPHTDPGAVVTEPEPSPGDSEPQGDPEAPVEEETPSGQVEAPVEEPKTEEEIPADGGTPPVGDPEISEEVKTETVPAFDPNEHTVPEVNEHLAKADDAERKRVFEAEAQGQARTGIMKNAG